MQDQGILVITDHNTHGKGESIYPLLREMIKDKRSTFIDILSRGNDENGTFFSGDNNFTLNVNRITSKFDYTKYGEFYKYPFKSSANHYHTIFLRIDRPISDEFLNFTKDTFSNKLIINDPNGIRLTGSKDFLLNFEELCPPIKLCHSFSEIDSMYKKFPLVLKPLRSYGGIGIIKIENDEVLFEGSITSYSNFEENFNNLISKGFIAMKFLRRVTEGDKRVIVINKQIMGATLRFPPKNSFLCNLKQGGYSAFAEADDDEIEIARRISPIMNKNNVTVFGFDTLVDDDGIRKLSEINTLNVGGLIQAENHSKKPIIKDSSKLIWNFIESKI